MENKDNIPWLAWFILVVAIAIMAGPAFADEAIKLDPNLKAYAKVSGVSGNLNSIGSDWPAKVCTDDDFVDDLTHQLFRELLSFMLENPQTITRAIRITFIAKYL